MISKELAEKLYAEIEELKAENQRLRNEQCIKSFNYGKKKGREDLLNALKELLEIPEESE